MMRETIRIVVVEDAFDGQPREPRWQFVESNESEAVISDRPRPIVSTVDDEDSHSMTFLVEWFQALAGAEWQWT
jgi:hypothetical protein